MLKEILLATLCLSVNVLALDHPDSTSSLAGSQQSLAPAIDDFDMSNFDDIEDYDDDDDDDENAEVQLAVPSAFDEEIFDDERDDDFYQPENDFDEEVDFVETDSDFLEGESSLPSVSVTSLSTSSSFATAAA